MSKNINFSCQLVFNVVLKYRTYSVHCTPLCGSIACLSGTHRWLIQIYRPLQTGVIQSTEFDCSSYDDLEKHVFKMCNCQFDIDDVHDRMLVNSNCR